MGNSGAIRNIGVAILHALLPALYNIRVEGLGNLDLNLPGLIAFKHRSNMDVPFLICAVPKFLHFPAKRGVFRVPVVGRLLELGGGYPIVRHGDHDYRFVHPINFQTYRSFFRLLNTGGWFAYAPEGTRAPHGMGEEILPSFLISAVKRNVPTYLAGLEYSRKISWVPFTTVTIRFDSYRPNGNGKAEVSQEVRQGLARLSGLGGLEQKVA